MNVYAEVATFFRDKIGEGVYVFAICVRLGALDAPFIQEGTYTVNVYTKRSYLNINDFSDEMKNAIETYFETTLDEILKAMQKDANEQAEKMEEVLKSSQNRILEDSTEEDPKSSKGTSVLMNTVEELKPSPNEILEDSTEEDSKPSKGTVVLINTIEELKPSPNRILDDPREAF